MTIKERIDALTPSQRKQLSEIRVVCSFEDAENAVHPCCTFEHLFDKQTAAVRTDHMTKKEQQEIISKELIPAFEHAVLLLCETDALFCDEIKRLCGRKTEESAVDFTEDF